MRRQQFTNICRLIGALGCSLISFAASGTSAAELSPYEARVSKAGAPIYSGPGESFYPTDTLSQGEVIEIYREKPDGWCAIRPPKNNFSWVLGRDVKLTEKGIGEIVTNGAPSRIGSRINDRRNAVQVQLKQGEAVEILDEETIGGEVWYKISPPAGEFRWIHASCIERNTPASKSDSAGATTPLKPLVDSSLSATTDAAATSSAIEPIKESTTTAPAATGQWQASTASATDSGKGSVDVAAPPIATETQKSDAASPTAPPADTGFAKTPVPDAKATATQTSTSTSAPVASVNDDLARQLTSIELRLSRMVAAPPQMWNTELLERDAQQLLAKAQTTAERDAVKVTMDKLDRFASIGHRYNGGNGAAQGSAMVVAGAPSPATGLTAGLPSGAGSGDPRTTGVVTPVADSGTTTADASTEAGRYDAVGVLRPVVSKRPGAPQFALVDERGQVISFVSPTPDVNLQPYLGHRVGVVGNRGFIPEFQRAHVTAGRVQPLGDKIMR